jgi:hypothetical protein
LFERRYAASGCGLRALSPARSKSRHIPQRLFSALRDFGHQPQMPSEKSQHPSLLAKYSKIDAIALTLRQTAKNLMRNIGR